MAQLECQDVNMVKLHNLNATKTSNWWVTQSTSASVRGGGASRGLAAFITLL